jgi:hypothetical protein
MPLKFSMNLDNLIFDSLQASCSKIRIIEKEKENDESSKQQANSGNYVQRGKRLFDIDGAIDVDSDGGKGGGGGAAMLQYKYSEASLTLFGGRFTIPISLEFLEKILLVADTSSTEGGKKNEEDEVNVLLEIAYYDGDIFIERSEALDSKGGSEVFYNMFVKGEERKKIGMQ